MKLSLVPIQKVNEPKGKKPIRQGKKAGKKTALKRTIFFLKVQILKINIFGTFRRSLYQNL
jgi:hypothetical protein